MPNCVLRYCKSRYGKTAERDYSLFSFPPDNNIAREKWVRFVQLERTEENWLPSAASKLCSKHFRSEDIYFGKTGRAVLKKGSIPYSKDIENNTDDGRVSPISVYVSDSESIFDTPSKIALKKQVRYLQQQKICHQSKIKKLSQQNRYLKKKILNLKHLIIKLEKKFDLQKNVANALKATAKTQAPV